MKQIEEWKNIHQPFELRFWNEHGINWCSDDAQFISWWEEVFNWCELTDAYKNKLDIGCGPRPPIKNSICIEPLGNEYKKLTNSKWWDGVTLYSQPAEIFIPELENKFDFIICWNCLDHTYNYIEIMENINRYLVNKGKLVIGVDFKPPHTGHPGIPKDEFLDEIDKNYLVTKRISNYKDRDYCFVAEKL